MRNKADISYVLKKSLRNSTKLNQKGLAAKAKVANATVSDNSNGRVATFDKAVNYAKEYSLKNGPIFINCNTYRYHGHSMSDPGITY